MIVAVYPVNNEGTTKVSKIFSKCRNLIFNDRQKSRIHGFLNYGRRKKNQAQKLDFAQS